MSNLDLETLHDGLVKRARELVNHHWMWHLAFNEDRRPSDKSKLNLYLRERGTSVELFWVYFKFIRRPDQEKAVISRQYINKGNGNKYPDRRLIRYAQEDDVEAVLEFEGLAAEIRKALKGVQDVRAQLRKLEKLDIVKAIVDE